MLATVMALLAAGCGGGESVDPDPADVARLEAAAGLMIVRQSGCVAWKAEEDPDGCAEMAAEDIEEASADWVDLAPIVERARCGTMTYDGTDMTVARAYRRIADEMADDPAWTDLADEMRRDIDRLPAC